MAMSIDYVNSLIAKTDGKEVHATATEAQSFTIAQDELETSEGIANEIHEDHYHTVVQPLKERKVLSEVHEHQTGVSIHREIEHGRPADTEARLTAEDANYQGTRTFGSLTQTGSMAETVSGVRHHHHFHETIQPVIERETIEPSIIHTFVPIKEVHHEAPAHHRLSVAAPIPMDEFEANKENLVNGSKDIYHKGEAKVVSLENKAPTCE